MNKRLIPADGSPEYRQLWRLIDGAVKSCFDAHPEYLANVRIARTVRNSIVKRVTGLVLSYAEEVANSSARVRSGSSPADDTAKRLQGRFASGSLFHESQGRVSGTARPTICEAAP